MKFLLDANFLLLPGQYKIDVIHELREFGNPDLYTLNLVVKEVETLANGSGKSAQHARVGLQLLEKHQIKTIHSTARNTDSELVKLAKKGFVVCTQDSALRKRIKDKGSVVFLRQGRYLVKE